jgi:hypothetical protein
LTNIILPASRIAWRLQAYDSPVCCKVCQSQARVLHVTSATSTTAYCWLSPIIPALLTVTCSQSRCMCIYTIVYLFPLNLQTSLATNQHDVFSEDAIQSPPDSVLLPTYLSWPSRLRQSQRHHLLTCTQAQPTRSKRLCTSSRGIFLGGSSRRPLRRADPWSPPSTPQNEWPECNQPRLEGITSTHVQRSNGGRYEGAFQRATKIRRQV